MLQARTKEHWVRGTASRASSPRPQLPPMPAIALVLYMTDYRPRLRFPRVSILFGGGELQLHFQMLREHRAFQSAYLGQGGLLGLPGGRAFWVSFCVFEGHFRPRMPRFCTGVHPRWFCSSPYTRPCLFFALFCIFPSPLPAGTSGVFMYCFGGLRELRVFLCAVLAACGNYRRRKSKPGPVYAFLKEE